MSKARTQHSNASLTPLGRRKMVRMVIDGGRTIEAAADKFQVDAKNVKKWRDRFLDEGESGLFDRSSRPKTSPNQTSPECRAGSSSCVLSAAGERATSVTRSDGPGSTVQTILISEGLSRLDSGDRATADPIVRYQRDRPGELVRKSKPVTLAGDLLFDRNESLLLPLAVRITRLRAPLVAVFAAVCVPVCFIMVKLFFRRYWSEPRPSYGAKQPLRQGQ